MAQAFNHFVRFLMEHEPKRSQVSGKTVGLGCMGAFLSLFLIAFNVAMGLLLLMLCIIVVFVIPQLKSQRESKALMHAVPPELAETWAFLRWIGQRRELNRRTHPELRDLLEEVSEIRRITLDALDSEAWKARTKNQEGAQAVKDIEAVLRDALYDSIFIGRHLFRGKGQRETTFAKRCADPEFGRHALVSIGQIRDEMRLLSESALAAGAQSDLRVNLVKERLQALVDAEREIEEISSFDATE